MIEKYKIAYKSKVIDAQAYNKYVLNGPECYTSDSYLENMNALTNHRDRNLAKVRYDYFGLFFQPILILDIENDLFEFLFDILFS